MLLRASNRLYGPRIVPAPDEREAIIRNLHQLGHAGISKIDRAVVTSYFWKGMQEDVADLVNACTCTAAKQRATFVEPLKPTPIPLGPFELVAIDLMTLTKSCEGNRYLIVYSPGLPHQMA